jgi:hypothetical protein
LIIPPFAPSLTLSLADTEVDGAGRNVFIFHGEIGEIGEGVNEFEDPGPAGKHSLRGTLWLASTQKLLVNDVHILGSFRHHCWLYHKCVILIG